MKMQIRAASVVTIALAMIGLASCGHYNCGVTFGNSTCTPTGPGTVASAFAFAIDRGGAIDGFTLDSSAGTFAATSNFVAPVVPANSGGSGMVVAQGKFLYAVFEDLQQIYGWSIDSTGNLTLMSGFPIAVPLSGIPLTTYNQYTVITNPAGTLLFISEAGNEQILVYQIGTTGALTAATGSPFITVGLEPQNMGMDGLGKFLYVSEDSSTHSGSIVGAYSVQSSGTVLQAIAGSPFNFPLWEMQGDPSGKFLIGISGRTTFYFGSNDDSINVFNIDSTGAISPVIGSPFATTNAPFNIAVQPTTTSGALIYSLSITDTNSGANPVEGFQLNATTGALTQMTGSPFTSVMDTWGQFDPSGSFLFLNQGTSLSAFQVPSAGGLSAIGSPVAFTTLGYWAVADAQ